MLQNILNTILMLFGQFNICVLKSKEDISEGIQIQASFLTMFVYLIVIFGIIFILARGRNKYKHLYKSKK